MRLPCRVVEDYDVDRREVQGPRGLQPTRTNRPKSFMWKGVAPCCGLSSDIRGGFCRGVPPLPIPNREVKPARADGTDTPVGRVGRRRTSGGPDVALTPGPLFFVSHVLRFRSCFDLFEMFFEVKNLHLLPASSVR